jgi:hypothetical protein
MPQKPDTWGRQAVYMGEPLSEPGRMDRYLFNADLEESCK